MRRFLIPLLLLALSLLTGSAWAAPAEPSLIYSGKLTPLGHCQITSLGSSTAIVTASCSTGSVPTSFQTMDVIVETNSIRYWSDGTVPTASLGMLMTAGSEKVLTLTDFTKFHLIAVSGSPVVDLEFFGGP